ncbi:ABC transporter ATP-binding protein [Neoroseomonas oryzicola]|uniref:ABC transporter ATP-binding protein n=1 Tax=Neoroseomonas oryzicola TaxID=535904 RepID=A0A9X9WCI0_9PROT|nr:ABC transporter ATP-binding protein [Neoroseomonas oryzicola]MBR0658040.1 ABC transporter ATP-binding protein [Neoroseomonas oryzicola]NKE15431.1 ABC transporter ATP-binding protein [Neoroseomonas oryzicola]
MSAALKPEAPAPLVRARDLTVRFVNRDATVHAVNGVDLDLAQGEVLCLLGESGSGKSVTLRALMKLLPRQAKVGGSIEVAGRDVQAMSERQLADFRGGDVAMIFQEPMTALDPVFTIGRQIAEAVQRHEGVSRSAADARALELLELVQIPSAKRRLAAYPHELSGGLRQRAMIAVALACKPRLLLADEPTTALDATVQIQVLLLLRELQEKLGMGVIFVTHDLGVAGEIADRVAVMYAGRVVEEAAIGPFMGGPMHPYAQGLLGATVHPSMRGKRLTTIPGAPPSLEKEPTTCAFAPRCSLAEPACLAGVPPARMVGPDRMARCIRVPAV